MDDLQRRVDGVRRRASEVEDHLLDEYRAGRIGRREFIRRGTVLGTSLPLLSFLAAACGGDENASEAPQEAAVRVRPGGTIRIGALKPAGDLNPVTVADEGGIVVISTPGEYLSFADGKLNLQPRLAVSWRPNADATAWTFKLRPGVLFNDGRTPVTAEDVAATFERLADPENSSNALSLFKGVLSKGNVRALDATTVEFRLDAPNGSFPYLVSSENYNAIILPRSFEGDWNESFVGAGAWKLDRNVPGQSVDFVPNPTYWNASRRANAERLRVVFFDSEQARVLALQGGDIEVVVQFSTSGGEPLLTDRNVKTIAIRASGHRQMHMRTDKAPFDDKRVRQAMALLLDRRTLVQGLLEGKGDEGNDSPFAPVHRATDASVPQRRRDLERARALLAEAGQGDGFSTTLETWNGLELQDLAVLVKDAAREVGIDVRLRVTDAGSYYGDAAYGSSRWLDSSLGITDYSHRGIPNVFLLAPLQSEGVWNAAHFRSEAYDRLVADFVGASDLPSQRRYARGLQELLLEETPIVIPYFFNFLSATRANVAGLEVTALQLDATRAGFTA